MYYHKTEQYLCFCCINPVLLAFKPFSPKTRIFHQWRQVTALLWFCHLFSRIWISPLFASTDIIQSSITTLARYETLNATAANMNFSIVCLFDKLWRQTWQCNTQKRLKLWHRCKSHINYFQVATKRENILYLLLNWQFDIRLVYSVLSNKYLCFKLKLSAQAIYSVFISWSLNTDQ